MLDNEYAAKSKRVKERHETPMLSLDKTKDVERLREFLGDQQAVISWKMDGISISRIRIRCSKFSGILHKLFHRK